MGRMTGDGGEVKLWCDDRTVRRGEKAKDFSSPGNAPTFFPDAPAGLRPAS